MERRSMKAGVWLAFAPASLLFGALATPTRANLIASDSYAIGTDPTMGQYLGNVALKDQPGSLVSTGFADGSYNQGSQTANFAATAGGLSYAPYALPSPTDGKVTWVGAKADGTTRSVGRNLVPVASNSIYWFHILASHDGTAAPSTNGYALAGFGNTVPPLAGATAGNNQGLFFGFSQNGTANDAGNLVIRYRSGSSVDSDVILADGSRTNTAQVYDIVARLDVNLSGATDYLTYWLNPTDYSSQAALDRTAMLTNDTAAGPAGSLATFAFQGSTDFQRMTYSATNWTGRANFDEARLGTSLIDIAPLAPVASVPEPSSIGLLGLGLAGGLAAGFRGRSRRQIV